MSDLVEDPTLLAGEYVLGVLSADEMGAVASRALSDDRLAAEIDAWQSQLAPLAGLVPLIVPPAELWLRIAEQIGAPAAKIARVMSRTVAVPEPRALRLWRGTAIAAMAIAAMLATFVILPHPPAHITMAALSPAGSGVEPAFLVRVYGDGSLHVAALTPRFVPTGKDLELWALTPGAAKPASLGVLPTGGTTVKASDLTVAGTKLLVSLEPRGGSPTGQPTGPVLFGGKITSM